MEHQELTSQIRRLITLAETDSPVVSCFVNLEKGQPGYRPTLTARARVLRKALLGDEGPDFEEAFGRIEAYLASPKLKTSTRGVAVFARAGTNPLFVTLQFRVPLPTELSLDTVPHIYRLVELKDVYHRYVLVISNEKEARILEVSLGAVTQQLWAERPELRKRVGREWTKQHYQRRRQDRTRQFIKEKIAILDKIVSAGGHTHLMLAGNSRLTAQIRSSLPRHLAEKLVDVVPASSRDRTANVVEATLSSFIDQEQQESLAAVEVLEREIRRGGLAQAGTGPCLRALREGRVDVFLVAGSYEPPPGSSCVDCGLVDVGALAQCPVCEGTNLCDLNLKETLVKLAEHSGSKIETVQGSDTLIGLGGVGCLLRYAALDLAGHEPRDETAKTRDDGRIASRARG